MLNLKRKRIDTSNERQLITNLITSTEFCKEILPLLSSKLLKSNNSKVAFGWTNSYYNDYKEAPKGNLKGLFDQAMVNESDATVEVVSAFLTDLNNSYEDLEDFNIDFEVANAKDYLKRRSLEVLSQEVDTLLEKDRIDKAEDVVKSFSKRKESFGDIVSNFGNIVVDSSSFTKEDIIIPTTIIHPWLVDGTISMLYAPRGIGKTWLSLTLAVMITRKHGVGKRLGPWEVMNKSGVLYLDGEMGEFDMQQRLRILEKMYGEEDLDFPLTLMANFKYAKSYGSQISISSEEYRNAIYQYLYDNDKYYLLILDNISALTPGLNENSKEDWDPINQWLISLRHLGVSILLIHHSGKGHAQRGTSGREDALDCIIKMQRPSICSAEEGAKFSVMFEKSRNIAPGPGLSSFDLHLLEDGKGGLEWTRVYNEDKDDE